MRITKTPPWVNAKMVPLFLVCILGKYDNYC